MLVQGRPEVAETLVSADKDGVIRLIPGDARFEGEEIRVQAMATQANIGFWTNPKDFRLMEFAEPSNDGKYLVQIEAAAPCRGFGAADPRHRKTRLFRFRKPKVTNAFQSTKVGEVYLSKGAKITLTLRPVVDGWHPVNVRKVELIPAAVRKKVRGLSATA